MFRLWSEVLQKLCTHFPPFNTTQCELRSACSLVHRLVATCWQSQEPLSLNWQTFSHFLFNGSRIDFWSEIFEERERERENCTERVKKTFLKENFSSYQTLEKQTFQVYWSFSVRMLEETLAQLNRLKRTRSELDSSRYWFKQTAQMSHNFQFETFKLESKRYLA